LLRQPSPVEGDQIAFGAAELIKLSVKVFGAGLILGDQQLISQLV